MVQLSLLHLLVSALIGFWGRNYRFGFWGYFFATLLLTPAVGAFLVIASIPARSVDESRNAH